MTETEGDAMTQHTKQVAELAILLALTAKSPKLRKQRAAVGAHLAELMQKPHDR